MPNETMTPKERWEAVLTRQTPDRVPMDYWGTDEANAKLMDHMGIDDMDLIFEKLHIDVPFGVGGRFVGPEAKEGEDLFGCKHRTIEYATGTYTECVVNPLAGYCTAEEIEADYNWPQSDWWEYDHLPDAVKGNEDRPIRGGGSEPFLKYCHLRGLELAFIDLIDSPEIVHYCLDKLFDLAYDSTARILEAIPGQVLISYVAEDMGSQEGLMFSPGQIKEFLIPRMERMMKLVHEGGAHVFHHNDGAVRPILPDMIDAGIDVLNPVQWRCQGMEREGLKQDFSSDLIFHGGVDNQETMMFGDVGDVRKEVADNLGILGDGGGYIIAPCHNIQAVSPAENTMALYETGYEMGWS